MKKLLMIGLLMLYGLPLAQAKPDQPNVLLVFMDNLGWGEVGAYGGGILRGAAAPNIDSLARDGMKLLNFNV